MIMVLKKFTLEDIRAWGPCYDPSRYLAEDFKGTILDILDDKRIPFEDRLWVIVRAGFVSEKLMRLFAVWCARQVSHLMKDERSIKALDVAEAYANGKATKAQLYAAQEAARDAALDAADAAQHNAAFADAWDASRAVQNAAWAAAWDAARAVQNAARAARDAAWAAADAPQNAARAAQENKLREMIIAGIETGDSVCERNK